MTYRFNVHFSIFAWVRQNSLRQILFSASACSSCYHPPPVSKHISKHVRKPRHTFAIICMHTTPPVLKTRLLILFTVSERNDGENTRVYYIYMDDRLLQFLSTILTHKSGKSGDVFFNCNYIFQKNSSIK